MLAQVGKVVESLYAKVSLLRPLSDHVLNELMDATRCSRSRSHDEKGEGMRAVYCMCSELSIVDHHTRDRATFRCRSGR
jgi:hypothetical protein